MPHGVSSLSVFFFWSRIELVAGTCKESIEVSDSIKGKVMLSLSLRIPRPYMGERNYIPLIPTLGNKWR